MLLNETQNELLRYFAINKDRFKRPNLKRKSILNENSNAILLSGDLPPALDDGYNYEIEDDDD